jgi:hypothetical protein
MPRITAEQIYTFQVFASSEGKTLGFPFLERSLENKR